MAWSNSTGTRYERPEWTNPTIGRGKGIRAGGRDDSALGAKCLSVAINAFSDATQQPRFPDGKANESVGMKYQMINEIEAVTGGEIEILFFPGLNACILVKDAVSKSLGERSTFENSATTKLQRVENHVSGEVRLELINPTAPAPQYSLDNLKVTFTQPEERMVAKWRAVSYGLLLSLVNNSEENDGWWEACRISPPADAREFAMSLIYPNLTVAQINTSPREFTQFPHITQPFNIFPVMPQISSSQMLNTPSYSTGKLRNIHNVIFQLNPDFGTHEFIDMNRSTTINGTSFFDQDVAAEGHPFDVDTAALGNPQQPRDNGAPLTALAAHKGITFGRAVPQIEDTPLDTFFDHTFDAIFIRIHGVDGKGGRSPSRLTMHSVMNQEIIYDEKAHNARFHQPSVYHRGHDKLKSSVSAAQVNKVSNLMGE
jgi:hypothetical protein